MFHTVTVRDGEGRWGAVRDVERRECHDDGICVTLAKDGNGMIMGR
jgi:hypothetical protein